MLYDYTTVMAAMLTANDTIVGFRSSSDPCHTALTTKYTVSQSGLLVTGIPGVTNSLLQSACRTSEYTNVNAYLSDIIPQVIAETLNKFFTIKKNVYNIKEVLEHNTAQLSTIYKDDKQTQSGRAIGYEIRPRKSNNIKLQILSLSGYADTGGTITFYLYRANSKTAIASKQVTLTADNEIWADVTSAWITRYLNGSSGSGQSLFLLVYEYDSTNYTAGVQMPEVMKLYQSCKQIAPKYCAIQPVEFPTSALNWNAGTGSYDLPDLDQIGYVSVWNGLNFRYQNTCDLTQLIIDQKTLFARAIQLELAHKVLMDGAMSDTINDVTESKRKDWLSLARKCRFDLDGGNLEVTGVVKGEYEKLALDLSNLDPVCLPSVRRNEPILTYIPTT